MALSNEAGVRAQVLKDVRVLSEKGCMLSPGWWRQLGDPEKAHEVEEYLQNPSTSSRRTNPKGESRSQYHDIDCILDEKKTNGRAGAWFLVRWAGYQPDWEAWRIRGEPGSPIETWEPKLVVQRTIAFMAWREVQRLATEVEPQQSPRLQ